MDVDYGYLNAAIATMLAKLTSLGPLIDGKLQPVYLITGTLMFILACIKFYWQRDLAPLAAFTIRYIQLMILILVSSQWMPLTEDFVSGMGRFGAQTAGFDILQLAPGPVILRAMQISSRLYTDNVSWMRLLLGSSNDTIAQSLLLAALLLNILMALFMGAWIMLFFVVFKLASVVALVFLCFMMFDSTRFMAAPGIARILGYGVQMLVLGLVVGLYFNVLDALDLTGHLHVGQSLALLVIFFFFALLFKYTTDIAREQVSGMPTLGLHDTGHFASRAIGTAASMVSGIAGPALGTLGGLRMAGAGARIASAGASIAGAEVAGASAVRSSMMAGAGGGGGAIGNAPGAAFRMLSRPPIDATWTEARDLGPRAAQRMLAAPPRQLPPSGS